MATPTVSIVNQGGSYFVTPRALEASPGEDVLFRLVGPVGRTRLLFPHPELFDRDVAILDPNSKENDCLRLTVEQDVEPNVYPYAVYNEETKQFVRATPDPVVITD